MHSAKKYAIINSTLELIIVEGPVDCMRAAQYGKRNVVAVLGHTISDMQRRLLMKHAFRIVLAFDGDEAGQRGTKEAIKMLWGAFDLYFMRLPNGKDIGDLTKEEFDRLYQDKERIVNLETVSQGGTYVSI